MATCLPATGTEPLIQLRREKELFGRKNVVELEIELTLIYSLHRPPRHPLNFRRHRWSRGPPRTLCTKEASSCPHPNFTMSLELTNGFC